MLHVSIHAASLPLSRAAARHVAGQMLAPLAIAPDAVRPLPVTFDEAAAALEGLPRMFLEPDGSFVWVSDGEVPAWQLDGQLQDRGDFLDEVEIKGTCAPSALRRFLAIIRGAGGPLVFRLAREGCFLDEDELFRWLDAVAHTADD